MKDHLKYLQTQPKPYQWDLHKTEYMLIQFLLNLILDFSIRHNRIEIL